MKMVAEQVAEGLGRTTVEGFNEDVMRGATAAHLWY